MKPCETKQFEERAIHQSIHPWTAVVFTFSRLNPWFERPRVGPHVSQGQDVAANVSVLLLAAMDRAEVTDGPRWIPRWARWVGGNSEGAS